jgi:Tfp pilus assembly protein PilZ
MTSAGPINFPLPHFRAQSRKPVSLLGALRPAAVDVIWNREARVIDLGLGGACVETSDSIPTGTAIELVIDTPHLWEPLTLSGSVAWSTPLEEGGARIGLRFHHSHGGSVRKLTEFLEAEAFS